MDRSENGALLIVEDSDEDYALALWALRQAGCARAIRRARSLTEALACLCPEHAGALGETPLLDLVLLDLNLPDGTGQELLLALRAAHGQALPVPVIVLTTSSNPRDVGEFYQLGVSGYLVKPLDRERFAAQMRVVVDYWLRTVRLPPAFLPVAPCPEQTA
ncbi:Response regulator rcp1 [Thiorhodovibrio winogradskyi]|uniref:Response regulator rcp1 n=1 Tax=Thiorhodovibrio winogradskyi TaxID=77007 RepID=A0ABZ0SAG2_9GAMM|nr:response regulator [Thiorhodovibrio winogradskyi]